MAVAIITGAARGIGEATATALAERGDRLILVDRCRPDPALDYPLATVEDLEAVADRTGGVPVVGDVGDPETSARAVEAALGSFGAVDIAVAGAGVIAAAAPGWEIDDQAWEAMFSTNVDGVRNLAVAAIPAMLASPEPGSGRFVAVGSAAAEKATERLSAYSATKAAVVGYVRSLAADLAGSGITANVVQPGSTATALLEHSATVYGLDSPQDFARHHLTGRIHGAAEVAAAIAFLTSGSAAAITGAVVPVDGGMTAR